jgi:hypothetical protein
MKAAKEIVGLVVRVILIVALVFGLSPLAQAQSPAAKVKPGAAKAKSAATAKSARGTADGTQEGIKVHGEWTIVVRNPDGKEVARHEFKNHIVSTGMQMLVQAMDRSSSFGRWKVVLMSIPPAGGGACGTNALPLPCGIKEAGALDQVEPGFPIAFTDDLTKAVDLSDPFSPKLILTNFTTPGLRATRDDTVNRVSTFVEICSPVSAPIAPCQTAQASQSWWFTAAIAGLTPGFAGVPVKAGQLIEVTVKISFQ